MRLRRPPRLRSFDYTGKHSYFVTCGVFERRRVFVDEATVKLRGTDGTAEFIPFMKLMRQRAAMHYRRLKNEFLWQDGYFDRVLCGDDDLYAIVDYMRDNPVRAKLVENAEDYPFFYGNTRQKSAQL
jgi:REP element-mobilizing transposase RayT